MTVLDKDEIRMCILTTLVKRAPKPPGRTALMKFAYLLQTIRGIPLGYRFRLYNYGLYDEQVLTDARKRRIERLADIRTCHVSIGLRLRI